MEKKTETILKRYLADPTERERWTEKPFSWSGHTCATDGVGAIAIPGTEDLPEAPEKYVSLVFRDKPKLETPLLFRIQDIQDAMDPWPVDEKGKKIQDPHNGESLLAIEADGGIVCFRMVQMKRLCQTAKSLRCSMLSVTHISVGTTDATAYARGHLGSAIVVFMPYVQEDDETPIRLTPYTPSDAEYIEGWRVVEEGGILVGYKSSSTGINRVVTTATNPDEFKRQVTRPRKKKVVAPDAQISLMSMIEEVQKEEHVQQ